MKNLQEKLLAAFEVEHKDHLEAVRTMLDGLENAGWSGEALDLVELHRRLHSLKGAARAVDMKPIEALAHALESLIEDCQAGNVRLEEYSAGIVRNALDAIEDWVAAAGEEKESAPLDALRRAVQEQCSPKGTRTHLAAVAQPDAAVTAGDSATAPLATETAVNPKLASESMRVDARNFDGLLQCSAEILTAMLHQGRLLSDLHVLENEVKEFANDNGVRHELMRHDGPGWRRGQAGSGDEMDARLQRIARQIQSVAGQQRSHSWELRQLSKRLQTQVRRVRMVSAESVFEGMRKIVRDLARDQRKSVRVTVRGLETLADRHVLQSLKDPVLHLLRNAVNHGIEPPAERAGKGKPSEGAILFEITTRGNQLVIKVEDDGRGIARDSVVRIAQEKGLLKEDAKIDDRTIAALLMQPGISTERTVTKVAGRGIGLSIVKEAMTKLDGSIAIAARQPCGTAVRLSAPLSVFAKRLVVVSSMDEEYCIPADGIERVHSVRRDQIETLEDRPFLIFDDEEPLALVPLPALLGRENPEVAAGDGPLAVVEFNSSEMRLGAVVESIVSIHDGVVRELGIDASADGRISGGALLESGLIAPVLNVPSLIAAYSTGSARWPLIINDKEKSKGPASILVVDDSITTRTLEKSVLEASGYHVRLSVDGLDALEQLRIKRADLVISDIEMPRLDGFDLLKAMKQDGDLSGIPVILVTSRNNETDRRRGLNLGADAYVVKQRFDQGELLATIGRLT